MGQTIRVHEIGGGGGGAVDSFNGRTGAVVPQSGDYNSTQVTNNSTVTGASVTDALNNLDISATIKYTTGLLVRTQNTIAPSALDTPELIDFGTVLQQDSTASYNAGEITLIGTGQRKITFEGSYGRLGSTGTARLFAWFTLERGVNPEVAIGNSGYAELDDQDSTFPFNNSFDFDAQDGDIIRVYMIRDSGGTGTNNGFLESGTPVNTVAPASVSASIQIQYLEGNAIPVPTDATIIQNSSSDIAGDLVGNTNFIKTVVATGASVGDKVSCGMSDILYDSMNSTSQDHYVRAKVVAANSVEITFRCDSFVAATPGWNLWFRIVK